MYVVCVRKRQQLCLCVEIVAYNFKKKNTNQIFNSSNPFGRRHFTPIFISFKGRILISIPYLYRDRVVFLVNPSVEAERKERIIEQRMD